MNILVVAPYVTFPREPGANRFITIARMLSKNHKVTLVTSRFCHFLKKHRDIVPSLDNNIDVILLDEPGYNENIGLARFISHYVFCKNFLHYMLNKKEKFEIVYSAYPLIRTNRILGALKDKQGFKLVIDVQDIWPESISGAIPMFSTRIGKLFLNPIIRYADKTYSYADALISVSETYMNRVSLAGVSIPFKEVVYIGADNLFHKEIAYFGDSNKKLVAIYIGTMGGSYDLETVIRASVECNNTVSIKFIGAGPNEERLKKLNQQLEAKVEFLGALPYQKVMEELCSSDIAINPIKSTAQQSITNKLSDYFCCGLPILSCQENEEVKQLLALGGGLNYYAGDAKSLASQLTFLESNRQVLNKMSEINREIAKNKFLRKNSYLKILNIVDKLLSNSE